MGNNNAYYYQDNQVIEENPSSLMNNDMNKDYKGVEGIYFIYNFKLTSANILLRLIRKI